MHLPSTSFIGKSWNITRDTCKTPPLSCGTSWSLLWNILAPQDIPAREFACTQETLYHKTYAHKRYHKRYIPHSTLTWHTTRHMSTPQDTSLKPLNVSCRYVLWHNFSYVLHVCPVCMSCSTIFHMSCGYILCARHVCLGAQFYICLAHMSCSYVWIPLVCISCRVYHVL